MVDKSQREVYAEGLDISAVIRRFCELKGLRNDAEAARALGISPQALGLAKKRGRLDLQNLFERHPDVDPTQLLRGKPGSGSGSLDAALAAVRAAGGEIRFPPNP